MSSSMPSPPNWQIAVFPALLWLLLTSAPLAAQDCGDNDPARIPNSRFVVNQDGTVRDEATGLMWKQCAEGLSGVGCTAGTALTFKWKQAMRQGQDNLFAGHADWRLPTQTELLSLIQRRCYGLDIDVANFPNTPPAPFWTATSAAYYGGDAWTIHFGTGATGYGTRRDSAHVRLVRDSAACSPARPGSCVAHEARVPLPPAVKSPSASPFLP